MLNGLVSATVFGLLGIALMVVGFLVFDRALRKVDIQKELAERQNMAVAVVTAALILAIGWIVVHAIGA